MVVDLEQGSRTAKRRLEEAGLATSEAVDYLRVPDGLRLDQDAEQRAALESCIAERGIDVVVLDPFYKAHGLEDSSAERSMVELMRILDGWRERYGVALLLPAHTRKRGQDGKWLSLDDVFGSSALTRGAEIVVGLELVRPGYSRFHVFKDRDGADDLPARGQAWTLRFDRDSGYRRDLADATPSRNIVQELVALALTRPGWRTLKEWKSPRRSGGIGAGEDAVREALEHLVVEGRFEVAVGPPGRAPNARCWRLAEGAPNPPGHPAAPEAPEPAEECTASVPPPPIGGTRRQGTSEAAATAAPEGSPTLEALVTGALR